MIWMRLAGAGLFVIGSVVGYAVFVRQTINMAPPVWMLTMGAVGLTQAAGLLMVLYTRDRPNEPGPPMDSSV